MARNKRRREAKTDVQEDVNAPPDHEEDNSVVPTGSTDAERESTPNPVQEQWESFRDEHYEVIEQLPLSLHRLFALLHELDKKYESLTGELQSCVKGYAAYRESLLPSEPMSSLADASDRIKVIDQTASIASPLHHAAKPETKDAHNPNSSSIPPASPSPKAHGPIAPKLKSRQMLEHIAHLMAESVKASEEKLALAASAYDSVDRHVRSLDSIIKTDETALLFATRPGTLPAASVIPGVPNGPTHDVIQAELSEANASIRSRKRGIKRKGESVQPSEVPPTMNMSPTILPEPISLTTAAPVMPVDPNEPKYCYCNQVSYGEMVACDNEDCEREWFHYGCVDLKEAPKHKWYCRDCEALLGRVKRRK